MDLQLNSTKKIKRVKEVLSIASKYGFGHLLDKTNLSKKFSGIINLFSKKKFEKISTSKRIRLLLEELGPVYVKFGQMLSTRIDIFPKELIEELSNLQENVKPFETKIAKKVIVDELNSPIDKIFKSFENKLVASASLGQVYQAVLKNGKKVAIKVKRPEIETRVKEDLQIINEIIKLFEETELVKHYRITELFEEFERQLEKELNYELEGANISKFYNNFKKENFINIPKYYPEYSKDNVLTMEFIEGISVNNFLKSNSKKYNKKLIARRGLKAFYKQIFEDGIFHGDPHPGNIFVLKDNKISFLDFGNVVFIEEDDQEKLFQLFSGIVKKDVEIILQTVLDISTNYAEENLPVLREGIRDILEEFYSKELEKINIGDFLNELFSIISQSKLEIPYHFVLLGRSLIMIESIGRQLYPKINIMTESKPYVEKITKEKINSLYPVKTFSKKMIGGTRSLINIPQKLESLLDKFQRGNIKTEIEGKEIRELEESIFKVGNRFVLSALILALTISSSLIWYGNAVVTGNTHSIIAIIGFAIAILLTIYLSVDILRFKFLNKME